MKEVFILSYNQLITDSNLAFVSGEFILALEKAKEAIRKNSSESEGYYCAGKACMSINQPAEAVSFFKQGTMIDKTNGNGFFLLGYAQATNGEMFKSLQSLTKALECNCDVSLKGQIYKMLSMINTEQEDYQNALLNLAQAEDYLGLDIEILQQKAACYANLKDYHQTLFTLNQMKLLQPKEYSAYSLAFNVFMELEIYDEALAELERAEKFADLTITYYNDKIAYTLLNNPKNDTKENIKAKWIKTLKAIQEGLDKGKPNAEQVFELYIKATQLYITLENPKEAIRVLDASANPIASFNNHFMVIEDDKIHLQTTNDIDEELSFEDEESLMQEKWENGEFDEIRDAVSNALYETMSDDPEEISEEVNAYLTPVDAIPTSPSEKKEYVLSGEFNMESIQYDMRNSMYLVAYELLGDYDSMLQKAKDLQSSSIIANQYSGIYYELKVGKYTNKENWQKKYKERISFWTKRMLEDPKDFISAGYRIRSYIDIGDFENAEQLCACLPTNVKEPLMSEIGKAKLQGDGEDGNIH